MNLFDLFNGKDEHIDENLRKWFKEKWVRFGPDGKIRGDCARGDDSEGKPKCLPQAKAQALGKEGRASAAARKRRVDPNPERSGKAINVATKKKTNEGYGASLSDIIDYLRDTKPNLDRDSFLDDVYMYADASFGKPETDRLFQDEKFLDKLYMIYQTGTQGVTEMDKSALQPGRDGKVSHSTYGSRDKEGSDYFKGKESPGKAITAKQASKDALDILKKQGVAEEQLDEKQDACYHKVKSRYKVWPSAYASGALVQCRKKGAKNWGNKSESVNESETNSGRPKIRRHTIVRPDGSKAVRYEVLNYRGVLAQGGFDDINYAREYALRNYEHLSAPHSSMDEAVNPTDTVKMDVPLLLRVMEYSKEDAKTDMDLHDVVTNLVDMSKTGETLTMKNYNDAVDSESNSEHAAEPQVVEQSGRYWCKTDRRWKDR